MKNKEFKPRFYIGDIYSKVIIVCCIAFTLATRAYVLAGVMACALILSFLFGELSYHRGVRQMQTYLENATMHVGASESMPGFPFPAVSVTEKGKIIWYNSTMDKLMGGTLLFQKDIREYAKDFDVKAMDENGKYPSCKTTVNGRIFELHAHKTPPQEDGGELILVYFLDINDYDSLALRYENEKYVAIIAAFDNYEEVMQGLEDEARNAVQTAVDRSLTAMVTEAGGVMRKTERDRYSIAINAKALRGLIQKKFQVLDTVREIQCGNTIAPTLSIGIGADGETFAENDMFARNALDMALGRGGDQVVLKDSNALQYFGGKTREVERRTKVKARVVALAPRELIKQSDNVIIIGHKNGDIDCIGAAMGAVAISRSLGKKAYILQYEYDDTALTVAKKAMEDPAYQGVFVKTSVMHEIITAKSLLLVMDTNSPSYIETTEFFGVTDQVVLIDHHRRSSDSIKNLTLLYHEPYASSTCEMLTEMLPYLSNKNILLKIEAEALYAGIYLDTKCFTFKTGVRTLEAAAYLRRSGIDPIVVKQYFKNNLETFTMKAALIQGAQVVREHIAVSVTNEVRSSSIIAQAADELLNIAGIEASFVIAKRDNGCIISGRSTGSANVQVILEKLGGGGHFSVAGAQLKDTSPETAKEKLLQVLEEYFAEN